MNEDYDNNCNIFMELGISGRKGRYVPRMFIKITYKGSFYPVLNINTLTMDVILKIK